MKYWIQIPDEELFVHGVAVYYTLNNKGNRTIRVQPLGESAVWDRIGMLRGGVIKEEQVMADMFRRSES